MKNEWQQMAQAVQRYAKMVDLYAERQAFENWCASLGYATESQHHDPSLGYSATVSARHFDRWLGWLARAAATQSDLD